MARSLLSLLLAAALCSPMAGQAVEFEVASIKPNTSVVPTATGPPPSPSSGQIALTRVPARVLAIRAYSDLTTPIVVDGLPGWADAEYYDVTVKFQPGTTSSAQAAMWRALLADRMKLQAHYETRPRPGYRLVLRRSDGRLGPDMTPSTLECSPAGTPPSPQSDTLRDIAMRILSERHAPTPAEEATLLSQCDSIGIGDRLYAGATDMTSLTRSLSMLGRLDGPIIDATGLQGRYRIRLWAARATVMPLSGASSPAEPALNEAPSIFDALSEQLGLRLEKTTIDGVVLVIDHIERPTAN